MYIVCSVHVSVHINVVYMYSKYTCTCMYMGIMKWAKLLVSY